jgi:hypothetical protein
MASLASKETAMDSNTEAICRFINDIENRNTGTVILTGDKEDLMDELVAATGWSPFNFVFDSYLDRKDMWLISYQD